MQFDQFAEMDSFTELVQSDQCHNADVHKLHYHYAAGMSSDHACSRVSRTSWLVACIMTGGAACRL